MVDQVPLPDDIPHGLGEEISRSLFDEGNLPTREWLCSTLGNLLHVGLSSPEPDHQAMAKYCELLNKLLPNKPVAAPPVSGMSADALAELRKD